jgi:hypothetical protein
MRQRPQRLTSRWTSCPAARAGGGCPVIQLKPSTTKVRRDSLCSSSTRLEMYSALASMSLPTTYHGPKGWYLFVSTGLRGWTAVTSDQDRRRDLVHFTAAFQKPWPLTRGPCAARWCGTTAHGVSLQVTIRARQHPKRDQHVQPHKPRHLPTRSWVSTQ